MRQQAAAAAMLLIGGCSGPAPAPPAPSPSVTLSTSDTAANVAPIVDFFRRTCLDAATEEARLAAAVAASGWPVRGLQGHGPYEPSIWILNHGQLMWLHNRSMNACLLNLDSLVSPTPAALGAALRPIVQRPGFVVVPDNEAEFSWAWPGDPGYRMVLKIWNDPPIPGRTYGPGRQAITLSFAREPIPAPGANRE